MRWILGHATPGVVLSLVCIVGAAMPGLVGERLRPTLATMVASAPQLVVESLSPSATASPADQSTGQPQTAQLLAQELTNKEAPIPAGPSTYVPILLYHYIRVNPVLGDRVGFNLSTPPAMFRAQMQYLANHGFHVIALHDAVVAIARHRPLPARPVVLTFDDGYADFFTTAVPALRAHGFTATDFVISGRMGAYGFMTAAQVAAADQMGFTIGAHTVDHYALAALAPARASWEMRQGKLALESLLGHPVLDFAYPYGSFNGFALRQASALGFETALSTLTGTLHTPAQLMYLSRIRVGGAMSLATFARLAGGPAPTAAEMGATSPQPMPAPSPQPMPTGTPAATPGPSLGPSPSPGA